MKAAAVSIASMVESISKQTPQRGFIHGDPHPRNVPVDGDRVGIIDFSDCGWGPYAYDIAAALVYYKYRWVWDKEQQFNYGELEAALLEGYASGRQIPENLAQSLPIGFAARLLVLVQWILDDLEDIDATAWTRTSIANSIEFFRRLCRQNSSGHS